MKKQSKINGFFKRVSDNIYNLGVMKTFAVDNERRAQELQRGLEANEKKLKKVEDERARLNQKSKQARAELLSLAGEKEGIELDGLQRDTLEVFGAIEDVVDIQVTGRVSTKRKKSWNKRPECWLDIVKHYDDYGLQNTAAAFKEEMQHIPKASHGRSIRRWHKDVERNKTPRYNHRVPEYGEQIDHALYTEAMDRILLGLTVDPTILREMLLVLLNKHNKMSMVRNNGSFGASWARRFFNRHNLSLRVV